MSRPAPQDAANDSVWAEARLRSLAAELDRSAQRARRLQTVTGALLRAVTPEQVSDVVVREGASAVGASGGVLLVAAGGVMEVASAIDCPTSVCGWLNGRPVDGDDPFAMAFRTGQPAWLGGLPFIGGAAPSGGEAWAILPLEARDRVGGVLALHFEGRGAIPDEYRTFLLLLAQQCAQAVERARLYEAERTARVEAQFAERQLDLLARVSARLGASLDEVQSLQAVAQLVVGNLADVCAIHLKDADGAVQAAIALRDVNGQAVPLTGADGEQPADFGPDLGCRRVLSTGTVDLVPVIDQAVLARTADAAGRERMRALGIESLLCVPIVVRDRILGSLTLAATDTGRQFSDTDVWLAEDLAMRLGQALDSARLFESTREASRAKSNFLAVMSHELRTPLNAILGYAELILLDPAAQLRAENRTQIERIRAAARHLLRQVDDVLSFSRAESGHDTLRIEAVRLETVVGDAVGLIAPLAAEKGLALTFVADPLAVVHTDTLRLGQILNNLLTNAVKFTIEGEIEVNASVEEDRAVITVRDTGIGIGHEHYDRIFDPFWQAEQSGTRRFGGTGIGLGVARHFARLLGGEISVMSRPGEGSLFTLRVPARLEAAALPAAAGPSA